MASDQYENADVYFVETGDNETIVFDDDYTAGRFYEVDDIDSDDVYTLSDALGNLDSGEVDEDYDDGAINSLVISQTTDDTDHVRSSALTTKVYNDDEEPELTAGSNTYTFDDVSLANATIIDTRGSSERNGDAYTREITSVSRLDAALDEASVTVVPDGRRDRVRGCHRGGRH